MKRRSLLVNGSLGLIAGGIGLGMPLTAAFAKALSTDKAALTTLAREAYIYLLPMVENYYSLYNYAVDTRGADFKAPFNHIGNVARTFTPDDRGVVTPNSDTPYSFLMLDLRAEPLVVSLPAIEPTRYYSLQLVDLYTHNLDFVGTRKDGNGGGHFLLTGPDWRGETPPGIKRVIRFDTSLGFALIRTQLFSAQDLDMVKRIQATYEAKPLSAYLGDKPAPAAPTIAWPAIDRTSAEKQFWSFAAFLLQFAPPLPWEYDLRARFCELGLTPGGMWPPTGFPADKYDAMVQTGETTREQIDRGVATLTSSKGLFGSPTRMKGHYWERALGAKGGIYGNDIEETVYPIITLDRDGKRLDTSTHRYVIRFPQGQFPPVNAFWSLTLYDGPSKLLVRNPLDRYLINSTMENQLKRDANGDVVIYIQRDSPGATLESNWLPASNGPVNLVMRLYLPKPVVLEGKWTAPQVDAFELMV